MHCFVFSDVDHRPDSSLFRCGDMQTAELADVLRTSSERLQQEILKSGISAWGKI